MGYNCPEGLIGVVALAGTAPGGMAVGRSVPCWPGTMMVLLAGVPAAPGVAGAWASAEKLLASPNRTTLKRQRFFIKKKA